MKASDAILRPKPVSEFLLNVAAQLPVVAFTVEPGGEALGNWWIEMKLSKRSLAVEWRPGRGFGIYSPGQEAYGEGPREVFRDPPMAARRAIQLLGTPGGRRASWLKTLRELHGVSQDEIAIRLGIRQANISKQERRTKLQLTTLVRLVAALGGSVEVRARFPEGELPLQLEALAEKRRPRRPHLARKKG
jgi:DNA-binding XRE family transcriptional regulator